jgi:hypothetical protein
MLVLRFWLIITKRKFGPDFCLFLLVLCLVYFSTLKMVATCSSETSAEFERTTRRYIPEDNTLHNHCRENLKNVNFLPHIKLCLLHLFCDGLSRNTSTHLWFSYSIHYGIQNRSRSVTDLDRYMIIIKSLDSILNVLPLIVRVQTPVRNSYILSFRNLYFSSSKIRMIKSRRMRFEGHVARVGRRGMHIGHWWESQKERNL